MTQKGFTPIIVILIILVVIGLILGGGYFYNYFTYRNVTILTEKYSPDTSPRSVDSDNVIYSTKKPYLINFKTGETKNFKAEDFDIPTLSEWYSYNSLLSPSRDWIIVQKKGDIWKLNLKDQSLKQLTKHSKKQTDKYWGVSAGGPNVSPDGRYIVYGVSVDTPGTDGAYPGMQRPGDVKEGLWLVDADGKESRFLLGRDNYYRVNGWMPDSIRVIFRPSDTYYATKTYDIDTNNIETLLEDKSVDTISWSKDGTKVVYMGDFLNNTRVIHIADNKFNNLKIINDSSNHVALLSPDGKYVLITKLYETEGPSNKTYQGYQIKQTVEVYLWDITKEKEIKLPITFNFHTKPYWSLDSKKLIYVKQDPDEKSYTSFTDKGNLYIYDVDSKKETPLTNSSDLEPYNLHY